ncbi:MAG TPA: class I SAM-dependent methyltransferase [Acetobacteraceae bacterium]|nr:class I SAM-dependent methyltransferase [Acetobacteraceae bacterium]
MERKAAERYVRELYRFVLHRDAPGEAEVAHWTEHLLANPNPIRLFRAFATSRENAARLEKLGRHRTEYPNGHFYSPVVDTEEVRARSDRIFQRGAPAGVDLDPEGQIALLRRLAPHIGAMPFSDEPDGRHRYYYNNTSFSFGDAAIHWAMLALRRPQRIIEVGGGFTSGLVLDAIEHLGLATTCTFIDPYPELLHKVVGTLDPKHEVIASAVQDVDPSIVEVLGPGDLLFIDSTHVVKTWSDVVFEVTEMLPRVRPGVLIHFHDCFYPFEYPVRWVVEDNKSWNELYLLQAFLMYNADFVVRYFNHYVATCHAEALRTLVPDAAERILLNPGGGLWMERVDHAAVPGAAQPGGPGAATEAPAGLRSLARRIRFGRAG